MARHGIPSEVMSDNSPFNAAEFRAFAEKYGFKHVTSSPRYSQSNGRVENSVKTAKRIMTKAAESGYDPHLALLDWRNTPAESGLSPVQVMFNRRTRTTLPMADHLLAAPRANEAHTALNRAKDKQVHYYNKGARDRPPLDVGQTVRVKLDDKSDWQKGQIVNRRPFRSYDVQLESGVVRRRTSRHVRWSREPPIVINDGETDTDIVVPAASLSSSSTVAPQNDVTSSNRQTQPSADAATRTSVITTRSGRPVIKPARYRDS